MKKYTHKQMIMACVSCYVCMCKPNEELCNFLNIYGCRAKLFSVTFLSACVIFVFDLFVHVLSYATAKPVGYLGDSQNATCTHRITTTHTCATHTYAYVVWTNNRMFAHFAQFTHFTHTCERMYFQI